LEYITKFLRAPFRPDATACGNMKNIPGRSVSGENFAMYSNL